MEPCIYMKTLLTRTEEQLLQYLTKNYILLPTNQNKQPLVKDWNTYNQNYYQEKRSIEKLLTLNNSYGLRTGKLIGGNYYFIVLDLDDYWAKTRMQVKRYVQTNQGIHLYCLIKELPTSQFLVNQQENKIGELHSQGRFVIGIGSLHQSGVRYTLKGKNNERYFYKFTNLSELEQFLSLRKIFLKPWNWKKEKSLSKTK